MGTFYVYEHWRPDRDEPFYVGKGKGRRANVLYGRNEHHRRIQKKLAALGMCVEVRLVAEGLTSDRALALEIERISFWRASGVALANRTDGGEGGANPAADTRAKMRAAKLGRKLTEEHKRKIGEASRAAQASPEAKQKRSMIVREVMGRPEVKAKLSASQKARVRTKAHYEKVSAALKGRKLSPEHIEAMRRGLTGRKQDRAHTEKIRKQWTPERRERQAEIARRAVQIREERKLALRLAGTE